MASGWNLWVWLQCIIINFPYSTCIRSFFGSSILTSLFIFKCFFGLVSVIFFTIYSKRYSYNIRDRSKKSITREYKNYLIISVIKNVECASTARARASHGCLLRATMSFNFFLNFNANKHCTYMNNMTNTFQRWLKMSGIAVAGEKQQRSLAKELVGENIAAEPVAMSFPSPRVERSFGQLHMPTRQT